MQCCMLIKIVEMKAQEVGKKNTLNLAHRQEGLTQYMHDDTFLSSYLLLFSTGCKQ